MKPFEPIGEQARWRTIYAILQASPVDTVIKYEELGEALGLDPEGDRRAIQMAMRRAAKEYLEQDRRSIDVEANQGYRVVQAKEKLGLAKRQGKKAARSMERGYSTVVHVDLSAVKDPQVREMLAMTARAFQVQMNINMEFANQLADVAAVQATDSAEVARLRERMDVLEQERREQAA